MGIPEIVNTIKKAVYGREVRSAIASGIEEIDAIAEEARKYAKEAVVNKMNTEVVERLPTIDISTNTIYFLKRQYSTDDGYSDITYDEYMYVSGKWEMIGLNPQTLANNNAFTHSLANKTEFIQSLVNNTTFGSDFADKNNGFPQIFATNAVFGERFAFNDEFLNTFPNALQNRGYMVIPRPSSGDAGKILVAAGSGSVSWATR